MGEKGTTNILSLGWSMYQIQDLCALNPKHDGQLPDALEISFVPMSSVNEYTGVIQIHETKLLGQVRRGYTHFAENDVIFAKITPCLENGKTAIANSLVNGLACGSTEFYVLRSYGAILPEYLYSFLRQTSYRNDASEAMTGVVGQARLPKEFLLTTTIPLPPLNEQKRIVAKIETLRTNLQCAEEALDEARQLENTLIASYTTGWNEGLLGDHIQGRIELAGEYWRKYPVVGLSNEGQITDRREPLSEKSAHRCKVIHPGDIVFNPIRFSIGSIARYRGTEPAVVSPEYQVFQTLDTMSSELLCRYLRSPQGRSRLEIETQGSVRYRVYLSNLKQLMMPIAPPEKQAEAERFFLALNKAFASVEEALLLTPWLEQSILNKAFRGELVPQNPNDEPASVLLERIQAERIALVEQKPANKRKRVSSGVAE